MVVTIATLLLLGAVSAAPGGALGASTTPSSHAERIINGAEVTEAGLAKRWPWIVALIHRSARSQFQGQFCGGSLIAPDVVLTAGHCLFDDNGNLQAPRSIGVLVGRRTLSRQGMGTGDAAPVAVSDVYLHPAMSEARTGILYRDVALLRLATPLADAPLAPLSTRAEASNWGADVTSTGFIAGWGNTSPRGLSYPSVLRQASVPIYSGRLCRGPVVRGWNGPSFRPQLHLCAGERPQRSFGNGACYGDSGGPLLSSVGENEGDARVVGITSTGIRCGVTPAVFTRITGVLGWIRSIPGVGAAATDPPTGPGGIMAVRDLRARPNGVGTVKLTWSPGADGPRPTRYVIAIRRGRNAAAFEELVDATTHTFFNVPVPSSRRPGTYVFSVRAVTRTSGMGPVEYVSGAPRPVR